MTTKGGYAAMPRETGDRFYTPRYHKEIKEQQRIIEKQKRLCQKFTLVESVNGVDVSSEAAKVASVPRSLGNVSPAIVTNLDRMMDAVTPFVQARLSSEVSSRRQRSFDLNSVPFYYLEDLWESFSEWSVYGVGVSFLLNGNEPVEQFYVPSLSGIQLYIDKSCAASRTKRSNEDTDVESNRLTRIASCSDSEGDVTEKPALNLNTNRLNDEDDSHLEPFFEYLEHEQPYNRRPFSDKISLIASQSPDLTKCRSSDLHPSSWMCVAWYPIYRIPVGSTLQDLDASFLTFHLLSTKPRTNKPALFHGPNSRTTVNGIADPIPRISLPVFGLASYKIKDSIVSCSKPYEFQQEECLLEAADKWLADMEVKLPDYQFFRGHYSPRR